MNIELNVVALLAGAVASMAVGALWYSPVLFAKPWMKIMGKKADELMGGSNPAIAYALTFVGSLVMSYVLWVFLHYAGASEALDAAMIGFWAWLGFTATAFGSNYLFEGKARDHYLITAGHYLVSFVVVAVVLSFFF